MKEYFYNYNKRFKYLVAFTDTFIILATIFISYFLRVYLNYRNPTLSIVIGHLNIWHLSIVPLHIMVLYVFDLYNLNNINVFRFYFKIVISVVIAGIIISGVFFFFPKYVFGRQVLVFHILILSASLVVWRVIAIKITNVYIKSRRIALLCTEKQSEKLIKKLSEIVPNGSELTHICFSDSDVCFSKIFDTLDDKALVAKGINHCSTLSDLLKDELFDILIFDSSNGSFSNQSVRMILEMRGRGKAVFDFPNFYKNLTGQVPLDFINGNWLLTNEDLQGGVSKPYIRIKRLFDILFSSFLIVILSPFTIICAVLVKLESRGNIIYSQERIGKNRKPFKCYKFRTMFENAEDSSGPVWSTCQDSRTTRLGKILRKTRLDEIPQLWNILRGDISFVGPRPIRKYFADQLTKETPFYELRFSIQPGLSGWAQVHGCYAVPYGKDTLQYELFYIQNMSLFLDIITIFKTIQSFFKVEGK